MRRPATRLTLWTEEYRVVTPEEVDLCFRLREGMWEWKTGYRFAAWDLVERGGKVDPELLREED